MRPSVIPKGTTPRGALVDLLPAEHAARVPGVGTGSRHRDVIKLRGDGGGRCVVTIDGASRSIRGGEGPDRQFLRGDGCRERHAGASGSEDRAT